MSAEGNKRAAREGDATYMGTREVADYLRMGERTIYELVQNQRIPCAKVAGKWLVL